MHRRATLPALAATPHLNRQAPSEAKALDQYYTCPHVAEHLYAEFVAREDPSRYLMVEPSAGTGSFFDLLPLGSLGFDVDPKHACIVKADFFDVKLPQGRPIAIIGNPPFGKNASMAVRFFNKSADDGAIVIAFILPKTFRKASIQNRLAPEFLLVFETEVPDNAFLFEGKPYSVPAVFQIWRRSDGVAREKHRVVTTHPDFEFTTPDRADFAVQRVGARAGRIHRDFTRSPSSTYFIKGGVEDVFRQLNFADVVGNVAGNPSLSKSEIVTLYTAWQMRQRTEP